MGRPCSSSLVFVLGFFMSLGKAAVYKHIPVYYPEHVGAVGGLVGMIGGLGGFVLPILFGCPERPDRGLDELLHAAVLLVPLLAGLDAFRHPADGARGAQPGKPRTRCRSCPEMQPIHNPGETSARWRRG
jgi:NNP family nitrate/nitrite transporter-like MFS transporter